ncbi:MAG: hypothetical protein PHV34_18195 [Verrucomicrobiae bacterium]|nr:hypothetical protein [Verrucomicrobiae bacterium]
MRQWHVMLVVGLLWPLLAAMTTGGAACAGARWIQREWMMRREIHARLLRQQQELDAAKEDLALMTQWLPAMEKWHAARTLPDYSTFLNSQCGGESGLRFGGMTGQSSVPAHWPGARGVRVEIKGRSAALIRMLGAARQQFPAVFPDQWKLIRCPDGGQLSLEVAAVHQTEP